jgi:hypothetical protein
MSKITAGSAATEKLAAIAAVKTLKRTVVVNVIKNFLFTLVKNL